jgi:hypothetical protein
MILKMVVGPVPIVAAQAKTAMQELVVAGGQMNLSPEKPTRGLGGP